MGSERPKTIILKRLGAPPSQQNGALFPQEDVIQKNLEPLFQHTEKKKRAQEAYYEKNVENKSPLLRNLKAPVRNRLGRRIPFNGTNTSAIPPKKRLFKVNNGILRNTITRGKVTRKNLAQIRINRIRARQQEELKMNPMRLTTPKKIKLKRWAGNQMLRVEVPNVNYNYSNASNRHRQILNGELQAQIRELQSAHIPERIIFDVSYTPFSTTMTTHERFAQLS